MAIRILLLARTAGFAAGYRALIRRRATGSRFRFAAGTGTVRRLSEAKSDRRSQKSSGGKCQNFIFHVVGNFKVSGNCCLGLRRSNCCYCRWMPDRRVKGLRKQVLPSERVFPCFIWKRSKLEPVNRQQIITPIPNTNTARRRRVFTFSAAVLLR